MTEPDEVLFNPFAPGFFEDPYAQYKLLRDEDPVQNHPLGFWFVSRYEDVSALLKAGLSVEVANLAPAAFNEQIEYFASEDNAGALNRSMLDRDPPDHTRLRSLVTKVFTRRAIAALEPQIVRLVDEALDRMAELGELGPGRGAGVPAAVRGDLGDARHAADRPRADPRAERNPGALAGDRRRRGVGARDRGGGRRADRDHA